MGYPIRILHVVVNMNRGGAETLIMNLYRNMDRNKVQFDFLTCRQGEFDEEIERLGGRIFRIPYVSEAGHFGFIQALDRFFAVHPDYLIVHSHLDKMSGLVLRAADKKGIPFRIAHSHNTESEGGLASKAYKWYAGKFIKQSATHYIACSDQAAKWLFGSKESSAVILKNGIERKKFAFSERTREQVRQELGISPNCFVIGHVGRFFHQKNHSFLINVFARFHKIIPSSMLVMAGDGPLRASMENKVEGLNLLDHVKFLGVRADIHRLMQAFDVFAFPSFHEGLPVTLIEAQGAGLPCIISDSITSEADAGMELIEYCPLDDEGLWIKRLQRLAEKNAVVREQKTERLFETGFDIQHTAKWTETYYLVMSR